LSNWFEVVKIGLHLFKLVYNFSNCFYFKSIQFERFEKWKKIAHVVRDFFQENWVLFIFNNYQCQFVSYLKVEKSFYFIAISKLAKIDNY